MRNNYRVYDSDTHIRPGADTLEKYLSARVRELVPDLESCKVASGGASRTMVSRGKSDIPNRRTFDLRKGAAVGGWGADVPRMLGEAEPRAAAPGVAGRFMGSKFPRPHTDDWDVDARIHDMDEEGVDVQLLVNSGGPSGHEN
ncbi:MAG TPA: hypothetical protein VFC14_19085, partial [Burkholderiales bacterium]|nr:hypothetical protein [Burkholderiales bacterium]